MLPKWVPHTIFQRRYYSVGQGKRVKRKVLLSFGYVGSGYSGNTFQFDNSNVKTVENEIIGVMRQERLLDLDHVDPKDYLHQISWSRSSRTDKGVSAQLTFVTAKLKFSDDNIFDINTGHINASLLEGMNKSLASKDIQIFSCIRARKSISARHNVNLRSYAYYLPVEMLRTESAKRGEGCIEATCSKLEEALNLFQGTYHFHNYTRSKFNYKAIAYGTSKGFTGEIDKEDLHLFLKKAEKTPTMHRTIYKCTSVSPDTESKRPNLVSCNGKEFVKVEIIGQSFIYNQIRKIVGAAVGFSVGKFSRDYLLASLLSEPSPFHLFLPMAPASGLVLTSATFKHTNNLLVTDDQARDVLGIEPDEKDFIQRPVRSILQEGEHIPRMNSFFSENIFPQIVSEMDETTEIWGNELSRDIMEKSNIESMILDTTKENEQSTHPEKTGRNGLPTGLSTSLSIQYDVLPGMYILDACKALQHELSTGQLVLEASEVDKTGFIVKHIGKGRGNLHEKALTGRMLRKNK